MPPKTRVGRGLGVTDPGKNAKSLREFEIASFVPSREFRAVSRKPSFCRTNVTSASRVRTRRDSRMADIEDNTASARAKRKRARLAAGRRERRAPASKVRGISQHKPPALVPALSPRDPDYERRRRRARDARDADDSLSALRAIAQDLDIEHVSPRAAAASAAAAEHSTTPRIPASKDRRARERHRPDGSRRQRAGSVPAPTPRLPRAGAMRTYRATPKLAKAAKATAQAKKKETAATAGRGSTAPDQQPAPVCLPR